MADGLSHPVVDPQLGIVPHGLYGAEHRGDRRVGRELVQTMGLAQGEGADGPPPQPSQVGAATERGPEVGGERPHIGARSGLPLDQSLPFELA